MKAETNFRRGRVIPFLKTLKRTAFFSVSNVSVRGVPDFLVCCHGVFVGLELKASRTAKVAPLQAHNLGLIGKAFGVPLLACPENWEEVKLTLSHLNDKGKI